MDEQTFFLCFEGVVSVLRRKLVRSLVPVSGCRATRIFSAGTLSRRAERRRDAAASPSLSRLDVRRGTMFYTVGFENVTRCAIAALCWSRRCPYTRIASAPPSLWPSQRATVGMSTPDSMQRVANKWRKS